MAVVHRGRSGLELNHPSFDRLLSETAVAAEPHVRDAPGASLRPDPILRHAKPNGHLIGSDKRSHRRPLIAPSPGRAHG